MTPRGKRCKDCGQPMLRKGQRRKHPDDYRHAQGCPRGKRKAPAKPPDVARRIYRRLFVQWPAGRSDGMPMLRERYLHDGGGAFTYFHSRDLLLDAIREELAK